jgi:hypothetical protein
MEGSMSWKKANEGGGLVWCHDTGDSCHTSVEPEKPFAFVGKQSEFFDAPLETLAEKLNLLVGETQATEKNKQNKDPKVQIGFLRTGAGYLPVWKRQVLDSESLGDLVDVKSLTDLDAMTIQKRDAYLKVRIDEGKDGAWRNHSSKGGVVHCHHAGMSCFVTVEASSGQMTTYFAEVNQGSPVYDAALATLSSKMNAAVRETQAAAMQSQSKDPRLQIGFVSTGAGFLPVWKRVLADTERLEDIVDVKTLTHLDALTSEQLDAHLGVRK